MADGGTAEGNLVLALRKGPFGEAVELLGFQEHHRIGVLDRGMEQTLHIRRGRWDNDLQPGDLCVERLD